MRQGRFLGALAALIAVSLLAGCLPTQTIIVRFEDLKTDFFALESGLEKGDWAKFDWKEMTITISGYTGSSSEPAAMPRTMGAFENQSTAQPSGASSQNEFDLKSLEMTDTIVVLMKRRQERFKQVVELKRTGVLGEASSGLLGSPAAKIQDLDEPVRKLVTAENADRAILFAEVLRQRKMPMDKTPLVAEKFAEVQAAMAARGFWVQSREGKWVQIPGAR